MITFDVRDMTCSHCAGAITRAVVAVDRRAKVEVDLARHQVRIEPGEAGEAAIGDAIRAAGYTPVAAPAR